MMGGKPVWDAEPLETNKGMGKDIANEEEMKAPKEESKNEAQVEVNVEGSGLKLRSNTEIVKRDLKEETKDV